MLRSNLNFTVNNYCLTFCYKKLISITKIIKVWGSRYLEGGRIRMHKKIIGIFIFMLLIGTVLPVYVENKINIKRNIESNYNLAIKMEIVNKLNLNWFN